MAELPDRDRVPGVLRHRAVDGVAGPAGAAYAEALDAQRRPVAGGVGEPRRGRAGHRGRQLLRRVRDRRRAVAAAVQAQRALAGFAWPAGERVRVRMGVHTGTPTPHDGGTSAWTCIGRRGSPPSRTAARWSCRRRPRDCCRETAVVTLRDLGLHQLKDLRGPSTCSSSTSPAWRPSSRRSGPGRRDEPARAGHAAGGARRGAGRAGAPARHTGGAPGDAHRSGWVRERRGSPWRSRVELVTAFPDGVYFVPLAAVDHGRRDVDGDRRGPGRAARGTDPAGILQPCRAPQRPVRAGQPRAAA